MTDAQQNEIVDGLRKCQAAWREKGWDITLAFIPEGSKEHFKQMLPEELWDKLFCEKKTVEPQVYDLPFKSMKSKKHLNNFAK